MKHDFWTFFVGQTLSSFGTAFTRFAIPLLVYQLTGSSLSLAVTTALIFLPVVLFGLPIGAWADRVNRKHLMIGADVARAIAIAWLPILSSLHMLALGWIYTVTVLSSLLALCFETCQFAAVTSLVRPDQLMRANGRLQAGYSLATIMGSAAGGAALTLVNLPTLLFIDAATFLVSAGSLALTRTSFNDPHENQPHSQATLRVQMREGISFIWSRPILRNILLLFFAVNLFAPTVSAQLVAFLKHDLRAGDGQVGLFYAAGSVGVAVLSLSAGWVRRRFSFGTVMVGA